MLAPMRRPENRPSSRRFWPLAVICLGLPTAVAWAGGQGRVGATGHLGQWVVGSCGDTEFRKARGAEIVLEWIDDQFRVTTGYRILHETVAERTGDDAFPPGKGELQLATSLLATYRHKWFEIGGGIGLVHFADISHQPKTTLLPAATLRIGPEWLYLNGSLLDFSPESLGVGLLKMGVGGELGPVDLWGGLGVGPSLGGPTIGATWALNPAWRLRADGLWGGGNNGHSEWEADFGAVYSFGE